MGLFCLRVTELLNSRRREFAKQTREAKRSFAASTPKIYKSPQNSKNVLQSNLLHFYSKNEDFYGKRSWKMGSWGNSGLAFAL